MKILTTGGGTVAPIDDVRAIANTSTGRFSASLSEAALRRGASVCHVHTPTAVAPFETAARFDLAADADDEFARLGRLKAEWDAMKPRLTTIRLARGDVPEYAQVVRDVLGSAAFDVVFLAMAVSDYLPEPHRGKLGSQGGELIVRCRPAPKVIRSVRDWAPRAYLVGFKLTSGSSEAELIARATEANAINRTDLTIANDLAHYREGRHRVHLVRPGRPPETLENPDVAARAVDRVLAWAAEPRR